MIKRIEASVDRDTFMHGDCMYAAAVACPETGVIADGIGAPDPDPRNLVNWCFVYIISLVNIASV